MRTMEGGNTVDEGTLARADCEANLAQEGENQVGRLNRWIIWQWSDINRELSGHHDGFAWLKISKC